MNLSKKYYQLIPEKVFQNLDTIEALLKSGIKGYSSDCLKEVISIIACHVQKSDGFAPLKMVFLKKLVPQADKYLFGLIDLGIVMRKGQFIPGTVSYKYCFAADFISKYIAVPLINAKLIRRIELAQTEFAKDCTKSIRGHSEQTEYLKQLTIDLEYKEFIESHYLTDTDQFNCVMGSAIRIMNGDTARCSIDSTSRRFHSIVTNMAKGLRPFLRVQNELLISLDIKNSQPYLSTLLLTDPSKVSWLTENTSFALLLQTLKVSLNKDVKKYISLVISGQLYEYLMNEFSKEGLQLNRDETKKQVLRILFARNRMPKNPLNDNVISVPKMTEEAKKRREEFVKEYPKIKKARQIFKDRLPTVHRIFSKVRGSAKGDKFQNFKRFAILLQRIESYLMLDVILKRIYKELPGTIAITVHDSIMTGIVTNNVEAVRKIMIEELTFFVGFQPQIKIEENKEEYEEKEEEAIFSNQYDATTLVSLN